MDGVAGEDVGHVGAVSAPEDAQMQGKESDFLSRDEDCSVIASQETVLLPEDNFPRSSIQEFMDILDGKVATDDLNSVQRLSKLSCTSSIEGAEGRVQELTLENYNAILSSRSKNELEAMHDEFCLVNQLGGGPAVGSTLRPDAHKNNDEATSSMCNDEGDKPAADKLPGQVLDDSNKVLSGQVSSQEVALSRNIFSAGNMRTKIISKSGFSEYFVKSTLKGKGVICRGPKLDAPIAISGSQNDTKADVSTVDKVDTPLSTETKPPLLSCRNGDECQVAAGMFPSSSGNSLREWMRSRRNKQSKSNSLAMFSRILSVVDSFHSREMVLLDLQPSHFKVLPTGEVKFCGQLCHRVETETEAVMLQVGLNVPRVKRAREHGVSLTSIECAKQQKISETIGQFRKMSQLQLQSGQKSAVGNDILTGVAPSLASSHEFDGKSLPRSDSKILGCASCSDVLHTAPQNLFAELEWKWYKSPEELSGRNCTVSSNIYSLGVLLFELLSHFDSEKARATAMSDLSHRIFPPDFISENLSEVGLCLWLLHPKSTHRPTTRDVLRLEFATGFSKLSTDDIHSRVFEDTTESELLLHFLTSLEEQKQKKASKLLEDITIIESDIQEAEKRRRLNNSWTRSSLREMSLGAREDMFHDKEELVDLESVRGDSRLHSNVDHLESAYFSTRSVLPLEEDDSYVRSDMYLLENREDSLISQNEEAHEKFDRVGAFFDGLCKYARYSKLEVCGTMQNLDFTNSANVICSLSFDRDEDYFAAAGVSKKVKIFEFQALYNNVVDVHYPVTEMSNKSKLSCISWNSYIRNYLASSDYDGVVKLWDVSTGQEIFQYMEHEKRAWSVDFSRMEPTKLASGSDDCSVKVWSINERNSLHTIRNIANVCCVQYSSQSSHLLAFGSADYKICCYDLRNANIPWCILSGHEKAVSYVKFLDSETLVSASTDNTLKLWDLRKSSPSGISTKACNVTFKGHTNQKNFVGLSAADGYLACGSETNEVFTYYKSLPMPITSHKFSSIDPDTGRETDDDDGQFVSSVCWRGKSNVIVAANSSGCIKVLRLV